jgi:hypothetical protein
VEGIGVDLNRNYPFMFGLDNKGSSGEEAPCKEDYRGPRPLSEPETKAVAAFVTKWTNLKVVVNLHAYGNMLIVPFNYDTGANLHLRDKFPVVAEFYENLWHHGHHPKGSVMGNGAASINYTANGEASDWMLEERGIYAMSPELGTHDEASKTFFIKEWSTLSKVVTQNYNWIFYATKQLFPSIKIDLLKL